MKNADLKELYQEVAYHRFQDDLPKEKKVYLDFCRAADLEKFDKNAVESIYLQFSEDSVPDLLKQIILFPNLKQLYLNDCYCYPSTDCYHDANDNRIEPWDLLGNLKSLEKFWIRDSIELNQAALNRIASLRNLQELRLRIQRRSDGTEDFSVLKDLTQLKTLELDIRSDSCLPLWGDELGFVKELPALEYLFLEGNSHLDVSTLEVPPTLKLVTVPSYTSTCVVKKLRDAGIPVLLDEFYSFGRDRHRFDRSWFEGKLHR